MKDVWIAVIGGLSSVIVAICGAQWFTPDLLRLDIFFPTKEPVVLDDFVFVHLEAYKDGTSGNEIEIYNNPYTGHQEKIFDKATYVEHVWLRKTKAPYTISLRTSGAAPEIKAIAPPIKQPRFEQLPSGDRIMSADLALDQSQEFTFSGVTPNPKTVYVYRNGFQGRNSWGGKNVKYTTDRLTFVYDFSSLPDFDSLFQARPEACLHRSGDDTPTPVDVKWGKGIAIAEAFHLNKGDKLRIYWTWQSSEKNLVDAKLITCDETLR